jgi:hypothetical protein
MRTRPHRLAVWNREQLREAVTIHGVDAGSVIVTGAANFDQWFAWSPRPAEDFRRRVGLDLERPYVLWVCSALNKWEQPENVFFAQWLQALRTAEHAVLREAAVLLRPHPLRLDQWQEVDVAGYDGVVMWPRHDMTMPVDAEQKADYYDSIYHSRAVVGINTSAMIEASIIGRPVLTVLEPAHHDSQFGALHFSYLVELGGGLLRVAASLHEHLSDLAACIASRDSPAAAQGFVGEFVRPHGIDRPATALVVDAIESLAGTPVAAERDPIWLPVVRLVLRVASFVHGGRKSRAAIRKRLLSARTTIRKVAARAVRRGKRSRHRLARRARRARRLVWRLRQRSKDSLRSAGEV